MAVLASNAKEISDWLVKAGIVRDSKDPVGRVIIDLNFSEPFVKIYITKYAEKRTFTVVPPDLGDAKIVLVDK